MGKVCADVIVAETVIPGNWLDFLHMDSNKTELFKFLSDALFKSYNQEKQLVITDGESVLSKPPLCDLASNSLSPCSHEEADTRMLLHTCTPFSTPWSSQDTDPDCRHRCTWYWLCLWQ